jgi:histidine kinase
MIDHGREPNGEIGKLAKSIDQMRREIGEKQEEIKQHWYEYQKLFEEVPCYITVQDRNLKILRYNREFAERFSPEAGEYCFKAYKGRSENATFARF